MTLADIPVLRASAEALRNERYRSLIDLLQRVPGGIETFASYEGALRELEIIAKQELELVSNDFATGPFAHGSTNAHNAPGSFCAPSRDFSAPASHSAREEPASADFSTSAPAPFSSSAGDSW